MSFMVLDGLEKYWNMEREQDYVLDCIAAITGRVNDLPTWWHAEDIAATAARWRTPCAFLAAYRRSLQLRVMGFEGEQPLSERERDGILKLVSFIEEDERCPSIARKESI